MQTRLARSSDWGELSELTAPLGEGRSAALLGHLKAGRAAIVADACPKAVCSLNLNEHLLDAAGRPTGLIGHFSADSAEATASLLAFAAHELRRRGAGRVLGPMDGDTWHHYRLNVGPFDERPFLLEPWNPPTWPTWWRAAGATVAASYHSRRIDLPLVCERLAPIARRCARHGWRFRSLELDRFDDELALFYDLSIAIFRDNLFYTPTDRATFIRLYVPRRDLVEPRLVRFAIAPDGIVAGFGFAYPEFGTDLLNYKTIGVLPVYRRGGIALALARDVYLAGLELGLKRANLCLIHDDNPSQSADARTGQVFRRYHLYELS